MSLLTSFMKQDILLRYITKVPHFVGTILENTLLGESILSAKTKEYTLLSIPDKYQSVWMTKHFRR